MPGMYARIYIWHVRPSDAALALWGLMIRSFWTSLWVLCRDRQQKQIMNLLFMLPRQARKYRKAESNYE